jgi:hypothetical protein
MAGLGWGRRLIAGTGSWSWDVFRESAVLVFAVPKVLQQKCVNYPPFFFSQFADIQENTKKHDRMIGSTPHVTHIFWYNNNVFRVHFVQTSCFCDFHPLTLRFLPRKIDKFARVT